MPNAPTFLDDDELYILRRRAAKDWKCQGDGARPPKYAPGCVGTIRKGMRYVEYVGEVPLYQSGSRICIACARERHSLQNKVILFLP